MRDQYINLKFKFFLILCSRLVVFKILVIFLIGAVIRNEVFEY